MPTFFRAEPLGQLEIFRALGNHHFERAVCTSITVVRAGTVILHSALCSLEPHFQLA